MKSTIKLKTKTKWETNFLKNKHKSIAIENYT